MLDVIDERIARIHSLLEMHEDPDGAGTLSYDAFISYSHARDGRLAPTLQRALHRLARPWYRRRALRVFRDQTNLSADHNLWSSIERALAASRFFILLASPEAAGSKWIAREVDFWRQHKPTDNLLIVLTDGDIVWDDAAGDFDWPATTALSAALRGAFQAVPHYVDLRWARTEEHLSIANPRFRDQVADLAATLHDRPKDDLVGEDIRQHRRTVRLVRSVIATLTVLTLLAGGSTVFALNQRDDARAQRDLAIEREQVARSGKLAVQAISSLDTRLDRSLLLSVQALRVRNTPEARDALLRAIQHQPHLEAFLRVDSRAARALAFSPDGSTLATAGVDGKLTVWDVEHRRPRGKPLSAGDVHSVAFVDRTTLVADLGRKLAFWDVRTGRRRTRPLRGGHGAGGRVPGLHTGVFSADGSTLAEVDDDVSGDDRVTLWDVQRGRPRGAPFSMSLGPSWSLAVGPAGRILATASYDRDIVVRDTRPGRSAGRFVLRSPGAVTGLAFDPKGETLASGHEDGRVMLWDLAAREALNEEPLAGPRQPVWGLAVAADGRTVAATSARDDGNSGGSENEEGAVLLWDVDDHPDLGLEFSPTSELPYLTLSETRVLSPDAQTLAEASPESSMPVERSVVLSNAEDGRRLHELPMPDQPTSMAVSSGGTMLATSFFEDGGPITIWDVRNGGHRVLGNHGDRLSALAFSADGMTLVSAGFDRRIVRWDVRTGRREQFDRRDVEIGSLAFSPDGSMLAAGDYSGRILLWDASSRVRLGVPLSAHDVVVSGLTFKQSDHGLRIFSRDRDGRVFLWEIDWTYWKERACRLAHRNLTQAEWNQFIEPRQPTQRICPMLPAG